METAVIEETYYGSGMGLQKQQAADMISRETVNRYEEGYGIHCQQ